MSANNDNKSSPGEGRSMNDMGQSAQLDEGIREVAQNIAQEMGFDELPMQDRNFKFFESGVRHVMSKYGKGVQKASEVASDTILELMFNPRSEDHLGVLYNFADFAAGNPNAKFDMFFMHQFAKISNNEIRKLNKYGKNRTKKHLSILPGRTDELREPGVAEEELKSGFPAPSARMDEQERQRILNEVIPQYLAQDRKGKPLQEFWRLKRLNHPKWTLEDITKHLNDLAVAEGGDWLPKGGGFWSIATVQRFEKDIARILENFLEKEDLTIHDVMGSRSERAIFQSRRSD
jgi:hypothetical protein